MESDAKAAVSAGFRGVDMHTISTGNGLEIIREGSTAEEDEQVEEEEGFFGGGGC